MQGQGPVQQQMLVQVQRLRWDLEASEQEIAVLRQQLQEAVTSKASLLSQLETTDEVLRQQLEIAATAALEHAETRIQLEEALLEVASLRLGLQHASMQLQHGHTQHARTQHARQRETQSRAQRGMQKHAAVSRGRPGSAGLDFSDGSSSGPELYVPGLHGWLAGKHASLVFMCLHGICTMWYSHGTNLLLCSVVLCHATLCRRPRPKLLTPAPQMAHQ